MSPEQVTVISAVATILDKIGTLPIGGLLAVCVLGPWVMMYFITRSQDKRQQSDQQKFGDIIVQQEKRFEGVVKMYESNVALVKCYDDISKNFQDLVMFNTQSMTEVKQICSSNLFCPLVRRGTKQMEAGG